MLDLQKRLPSVKSDSDKSLIERAIKTTVKKVNDRISSVY